MASASSSLPAEGDEPIYDLAEECENLFQQELSRLELSEEVTFRHFEECQQRFLAWTAYLGVFADRKLCLDRKLRHHPDLQDHMLRILDILKKSLVEMSESGRTLSRESSPLDDLQSEINQKYVRRSSKEPSQESQQYGSLPTIVKDILKDIHGSIDRLNRLGIAIRRSSTRSLLNTNRTDMSKFDSFKDLSHSFLKILYPDASNELHDQLSKSMAERYIHISKVQSSHEKRASKRPRKSEVLPPVIEDMEVDEPANVLGERRSSATDVLYQRLGERPTQHVPASEGSSVSGSKVSDIDRQLLQKHMSTLSDAGSKKKRETSSIQINQMGYPEAPVGEDDVTCEWCFETRHKRYFEGNNWRVHVDRDLRPYVCVSEKCWDPTCSFTTFQEWKTHMLTQHKVSWHQDVHPPTSWVCAVCHGTLDDFSNPQELYAHMQDTHEFTQSQLEAIVQQSRIHVRRRPDICPLCCLHVKEDPKASSKTAADGETEKTGVLDEQKQQEKPWVPESTPEQPRASVDSEQPASQTAEDTKKEINKGAGNDNTKSHIELMARHVAAHLQGLMFLTIRLMSLGDNDTESVSIDTDSAESGNNSTRNMSPSPEPHAGDTDSMSISDQEPMEGEEYESHNNADKIPDTEVDADWNDVARTDKQEESDTGLLKFAQPEQIHLAMVKRLFPDATESLQLHLARSMTIRRQRLMNIQRRVNKLLVRRHGEDERSNSSLLVPSSTHVDKDSSLEEEKEDNRKKTDYGSILPTIMESNSVASSSSILHSVEYPKPPGPEVGHGYCRCPYCRELISTSDIQHGHFWRKHVDDDLQPFVCLYSSCSAQVFSQYTDWVKHMQNLHSSSWIQNISPSWQCSLEHNERLLFSDLEELMHHMEDSHSQTLTDVPGDREALLGIHRVTRRGMCPLCEFYPDEFYGEEDLGSLGTEGSNWVVPVSRKRVRFDDQLETAPESELSLNISTAGLKRHIASHLVSIAFMSVKRLDLDQDTYSGIDSDSNNHGESVGFDSSRGSRDFDYEMDQMSLDFQDSPREQYSPSVMEDGGMISPGPDG